MAHGSQGVVQRHSKVPAARGSMTKVVVLSCGRTRPGWLRRLRAPPHHASPIPATVDRAAVAGHPGIMAARRRRRAPRHERDHADGRAKPHDPSVHLKFLWYACLDGGYRYAPGSATNVSWQALEQKK